MLMKSRERYAIQLMLDIVLHEKQGPISLEEISRRQSISRSYLEQLFSKLRKSGLVRSVRGMKGGYLINGELDKISILQIIQAVSKDQNVADPQEQLIPLPQLLWNELNQYVLNFLAKTTLQQLAEQSRQQ